MCKYILDAICQLKSIDISQPILHMRIYNEFRQSQDLTAQVESISKSRFLTLLGGECLDRFQVEIVIQMQVIQVLTMNQQVQHVVTLTTHLQTCLHPIDASGLKEFGGFKRPEQVAFLHGFWWTMVECIEHKVFQKFLIRYSDFYRRC